LIERADSIGIPARDAERSRAFSVDPDGNDLMLDRRYAP